MVMKKNILMKWKYLNRNSSGPITLRTNHFSRQPKSLYCRPSLLAIVTFKMAVQTLDFVNGKVIYTDNFDVCYMDLSSLNK